MRVTELRPREAVTLDSGPMEEMCNALGTERAEALVGSAMEELAVWLTRAAKLARAGNRPELAKVARLTAAVARRLGMPQLAAVARLAGELATGADEATLRAVTARMVRVGEASLIAVWDLEGMTV